MRALILLFLLAAGWRGRGLWATYSTRAVFHSEGGTHNRPRVVKFQLRN
jgi:hypothetical protein